MHLWFYLTEHNNFKRAFIVIQLKITEKTLFLPPCLLPQLVLARHLIISCTHCTKPAFISKLCEGGLCFLSGLGSSIVSWGWRSQWGVQMSLQSESSTNSSSLFLKILLIKTRTSMLHKCKRTVPTHLLHHIRLISLCLVYGAYQRTMTCFYLYIGYFNFYNSTSSACLKNLKYRCDQRGWS